MKLVLNKVFFNQLLFIICVVVPFFNNYELSFATWSFSIVLTLKYNYSLQFIRYLFIFIFILVLAIVVGLFNDHASYFIIRDITYLLKPITGLLLGYQLFSDKIKKPFQFIVYAGLAIASYHLVLVFYGIVFDGVRKMREIREFGGYFNDFEVYTLIILLFNNQIKLGFSKKQTQIFIGILAISSFFYLARTNFIQFVVLFAALKGYLVLTKRALKIILSCIMLSLLTYTAI